MGLKNAVGDLLHMIVSPFVMAGLTMLELPLLLLTFGMESSISGLPPATSMKEGGKGGQQFKIDVIQADDLKPETLRKYVKNSEPVIIKNCPSKMFDTLTNYAPEIPKGTPTDKLLIDQFTLPSLGALSTWIKEYVGKPVVYMAR